MDSTFFEAKVGPSHDELYGFGKSVRLRGVIKLSLLLGDGDNYVTCNIEFLVVDC